MIRSALRSIARSAAVAAALLSFTAPAQAVDVCEVLGEEGGRYAAVRAAERSYGAPMEAILAVIWRESKFRPTARPRQRYFGLPIGEPLSSAYGYAQVIDRTWEWYKRDVRAPNARRDDFADAVRFVGWYMRAAKRRLDIPMDNLIAQYLAYHQGHTGYRRGGWRERPRLIAAAESVADQAERFREQLATCVVEIAERENAPRPPGRLLPHPRPPRRRSTARPEPPMLRADRQRPEPRETEWRTEIIVASAAEPAAQGGMADSAHYRVPGARDAHRRASDLVKPALLK